MVTAPENAAPDVQLPPHYPDVSEEDRRVVDETSEESDGEEEGGRPRRKVAKPPRRVPRRINLIIDLNPQIAERSNEIIESYKSECLRAAKTKFDMPQIDDKEEEETDTDVEEGYDDTDEDDRDDDAGDDDQEEEAGQGQDGTDEGEKDEEAWRAAGRFLGNRLVDVWEGAYQLAQRPPEREREQVSGRSSAPQHSYLDRERNSFLGEGDLEGRGPEAQQQPAVAESLVN